ncbi:nucleotide sugar dehydrogenase [Wilcoxina mikolae CBS 423.85]|nr:nucleotide sugar dehydrogenase [Wilcoxina mikolae CBS 423.85]
MLPGISENSDTPPSETLDPLEPTTTHPVTPSETPLVAVIGVGYVGTHLVTAFAPHYSIIAFDVSEKRLLTVAPTLSQYASTITWTTNASAIAPATHFLIAVPTSLLPDSSVDTLYLREAIGAVALYARPGATVVVESSVSVGMTRKLLGPLMRSRGLLAGMSPERVDPGRTSPPIHSIPKLISGLCPSSLSSIHRLYAPAFSCLHPVSSPEVAEMTKLYENCQRMVGIAYANEMADACLSHGIDFHEVSTAAATKPFGYLPFTPGLGVGGPCIPVNPHYLFTNCEFPVLREATERMRTRPGRVGERLIEKVRGRIVGGRRERVLVVGVGFKKGQELVTGSPGLELMREMVRLGAEVEWVDPLVDGEVGVGKRFDAKRWGRRELERFDLVVVAVRQEGLDFGVLDELEGVMVEMWA